MRILERNSIPYETLTYEVDENHLDAVHVAQTAGLDIDTVFKTIVMQTNEKRIYVFCIPGNLEISLKKARDLTGAKSIELIKVTDLQKLTGYIRGGCSPLGMIRQYPTFIEETAQLYEKIYVSAGLRGVQLLLNPEDLAKCTEAQFASLTL